MPDPAAPSTTTKIRRGVVAAIMDFIKAHPKTVLIIAAVAIIAAVILTHL